MSLLFILRLYSIIIIILFNFHVLVTFNEELHVNTDGHVSQIYAKGIYVQSTEDKSLSFSEEYEMK